MLTLVLISMATASMTLTISKSKAFAWFRNSSIVRRPVRTMVRCHYCLGHWVALGWLVGFDPDRGNITFLHWFAVVAMASFMMGLILLVVPMKGDDPDGAQNQKV